MRNIPKAITILLATAAWALADQAYVVSKRQAARAAEILNEVGAVRHFCAPCGDSASIREAVEHVAVEPWARADGKENPYKVVHLNGKGIDLAYVYVERRSGWANLAMLVRARATLVPRTLPASPEHPLTEQ